jgi:hypothetical protein
MTGRQRTPARGNGPGRGSPREVRAGNDPRADPLSPCIGACRQLLGARSRPEHHHLGHSEQGRDAGPTCRGPSRRSHPVVGLLQVASVFPIGYAPVHKMWITPSNRSPPHRVRAPPFTRPRGRLSSTDRGSPPASRLGYRDGHRRRSIEGELPRAGSGVLRASMQHPRLMTPVSAKTAPLRWVLRFGWLPTCIPTGQWRGRSQTGRAPSGWRSCRSRPIPTPQCGSVQRQGARSHRARPRLKSTSSPWLSCTGLGLNVIGAQGLAPGGHPAGETAHGGLLVCPTSMMAESCGLPALWSLPSP